MQERLVRQHRSMHPSQDHRYAERPETVANLIGPDRLMGHGCYSDNIKLLPKGNILVKFISQNNIPFRRCRRSHQFQGQ